MGASSSQDALTPVAHVDVPRMFGAWFVIATMPTMFEKGAHNAIETYSAGKGAHCVNVAFSYNKGSFDGPLKSMPQTGSSWVPGATGGWKVSPFWPVKVPYLVIDQSAEPLDGENAFALPRPTKGNAKDPRGSQVVRRRVSVARVLLGHGPEAGDGGGRSRPARKKESASRRGPREPQVYDGIAKRLVETHGYPKGLPDIVKVPQSWKRSKATPLGWSKGT